MLKLLLILTLKSALVLSETIYCNFINTNKYGCNITNINAYSTQSIINGQHLYNYDNYDIKFVSYESPSINNLPKISQIYCQNFPNLEKIEISQIRVDSIDENALEDCESLLTLKLAGLKIKKLSENFLTGNNRLEKIDFGQNQLSTLPENIFINQQELTLLDLRSNSIVSLPSKIFASLENLKGLWLGENKIRAINPTWFENLHNLEELRLFNNKLTELNDRDFISLTNLKGLYLSYNRIKTLSPDCFQNLKNLEILTISSNLITELPPNIFTPTINLKSLWLNWNQLSVIHSDSFGNNKNLRTIILQNNKINQIDKQFVDITDVNEVNMENNLCSTESIKSRLDLVTKLSTCFRNYQPRTNTITKYTARPDNNVFISKVEATQIFSLTSTQNSCGKSKNGQGQIIGGKFITRGAFPWIAALVLNSGQFFCGGTIVSDRKVVTAAHCIEQKHSISRLTQSHLKVLLGAYNLNERFEVGLKISTVQSIHIHNDWNPRAVSYDSDIAVLVLERKVIFDSYIQPICMGSNIQYLTSGIVVGFGKSEDATKQHENIPKVLETPIHTNELCFLSNRDLLSISSQRTFCAGSGNGFGVCNGDSGSGLVVKHNGVYYLRGVVSSSLRSDKYGCDVDAYAVFTDVLKFSNWINEIDVNGQFYEGRSARK